MKSLDAFKAIFSASSSASTDLKKVEAAIEAAIEAGFSLPAKEVKARKTAAKKAVETAEKDARSKAISTLVQELKDIETEGLAEFFEALANGLKAYSKIETEGLVLKSLSGRACAAYALQNGFSQAEAILACEKVCQNVPSLLKSRYFKNGDGLCEELKTARLSDECLESLKEAFEVK